MRIVIEGQRPKWVRLPRTWRMRAALSLVGLLTVSVPIAWASHDFTDVPTAHQFHSQISAIKGAGITTGCGGGNYCPDEFVRRDAMAAFMHRGYGRVAADTVNGMSVPTATQTIVLSAPITVGLPAGALAGAAGFIQVNGAVSIYNPSASGCLCFYNVEAFLDGVSISQRQFVTIRTAGDLVVVPVTAVGRVTTAGSHTVDVRVWQYVGSSASLVYGNLTAGYFPFGSSGTNTLGGVTSSNTGPAPGT